MDKEITYSTSSIKNDLFREKHLIPYRVTPMTKYDINKYYSVESWHGFFKVLEVDYSDRGELEGATIRWNDNTYWYTCTGLNFGDYRLEKDKECIFKKNIINSDKIYTGAEIVYWFFMNHINCINSKYCELWKYVDGSSPYRLSDNGKYYINCDINELGNYTNPRIYKVERKPQ